ncbi:MAG: hypothetical protein JSU96_01070, partial [Acidobacteriota bacterium]
QNHFGNLAQRPEDDYDGDGHTNLDEFQDNTSPIDPDDPSVATDSEEEQGWWLWIIIAVVITVIVIGFIVGYMVPSRKRKRPPEQPLESNEEVAFEEIVEESPAASEDEVTFEEIVEDKTESIEPSPPPPPPPPPTKQ